MENLDNVLSFESKSVQTTGKTLFIFGFVLGIFNLIARMEILQASVVIVSGILGIIFMIYKIQMIRLNLEQKKRDMLEEENLQKKLAERINESKSDASKDS